MRDFEDGIQATQDAKTAESEPAFDPSENPVNSAEARVAKSEDQVWLESFDGYDELKHAEELMRHQNFGDSGKTVRPFTKQLRNGIRASFPIDDDIYKTVETSFAIVKTAAVVRLFLDTVLMSIVLYFSVTVLIPFLNSVAMGPDSSLANENIGMGWVWTYGDQGQLLMGSVMGSLGFPENLTGQILSLTLALLFWLLAVGLLFRFITWFTVGTILSKNAITLRSEFRDRFKDVESRVQDSVSKINYAQAQDNWARRAYFWTIIAQWNVKRAEYMDRYFTTVSWKIQQFNARWEFLFILLRATLVLFGTLLVYQALLPIGDNQALYGAFGFFVLTMTYVLVVWGIIFQVSNTQWSREAASAVQQTESNAPHPYRELAQLVEMLVTTIMNNQRRSGPK